MRRGFTLIEIIVAMTILSIALGVLLQTFGSGMRGIGVAEDSTTGVLLARSKLAEAGTVFPLDEISESGEFDDRYSWRLEVVSEELDDIDPAVLAELLQALYRITVTVEWDGDRQYTLSTLRVGPRHDITQ